MVLTIADLTTASTSFTVVDFDFDLDLVLTLSVVFLTLSAESSPDPPAECPSDEITGIELDLISFDCLSLLPPRVDSTAADL